LQNTLETCETFKLILKIFYGDVLGNKYMSLNNVWFWWEEKKIPISSWKCSLCPGCEEKF